MLIEVCILELRLAEIGGSFSKEETNLAFVDHFCASLGFTLFFYGGNGTSVC